MNKRTLGVATVAILIISVTIFLSKDGIIKKATNVYWRLYDWLMGIPHFE